MNLCAPRDTQRISDQDGIEVTYIFKFVLFSALLLQLGFTPRDFLADHTLFSIQHMRQEVKARLSRPPKDYGCHLTDDDSRHGVSSPQHGTHTHSTKRWPAIATLVSSTPSNSHREETW